MKRTDFEDRKVSLLEYQCFANLYSVIQKCKGEIPSKLYSKLLGGFLSCATDEVKKEIVKVDTDSMTKCFDIEISKSDCDLLNELVSNDDVDISQQLKKAIRLRKSVLDKKDLLKSDSI